MSKNTIKHIAKRTSEILFALAIFQLALLFVFLFWICRIDIRRANPDD